MEILTKDSVYFINNFKHISHLYSKDYTISGKEYKLEIFYLDSFTIYLNFEKKEDRDYYYNLLKNKLLNVLDAN